MENFSKNKRGRPPKFKPEFLARMRAVWQDGGNRTLTNNIYLSLAVKWLYGNSAYAWLFEETEQREFKRKTLLFELGKLPTLELAAEVAKGICEARPKVKQGVVMIRSYRLRIQGKTSGLGDPLSLANELIHAINDYLMRYPETKTTDIYTAINTVLGQVKDTE